MTPPHTDPLGPVVIGPREIYDAVVRVGSAVERLTDQHAATAADVAAHDTQLRVLAAVPDRVADHETRIRAVERRQWPLPVVAALLAAASLGVAVLPHIR